MKRWMAGAVCALVCAGAATVLAEAGGAAAMKSRLEQVASSYTKDNAFMGTVLVAEGQRVLLDKVTLLILHQAGHDMPAQKK